MKQLITILLILCSFTSMAQSGKRDTITVSGSGGGGGSTDTANLSNRINQKLNIADTINKYLRPIAGTGITITGTFPNLTFSSVGGGGGIATVSVVTANGFSGTSSGGSTPAITLTTPITGILMGNGTSMSAAVAGTNYLTPTGSAASLTSFPTLNQSTTGNAATVTNGLYSTGSYTNPAWVTSIDYSKITTTPTTIAGWGISDYYTLGNAQWGRLASANTWSYPNTFTSDVDISTTTGALRPSRLSTTQQNALTHKAGQVIYNTDSLGLVTDNGTVWLKQTNQATLTTIGSSGPATYDPATSILNIPNYAGGGADSNSLMHIKYNLSETVTGLKTFNGTTASDMITLGSENLSTGTGGTFTGTGYISGYTHTTGSTVAITSSVSATSNNYYYTVITISGGTAGSYTVTMGGVTLLSSATTGTTVNYLATATAPLVITPTTDCDRTITVSVKQSTTKSPMMIFTNSTGTPFLEIRDGSNTTSTIIGLIAGQRSTGAGVTLFGSGAGAANTTGISLTAIGNNTLNLNNVGNNNTGIGGSVLTSNRIGNDNTGSGFGGLYNSLGNSNTNDGVYGLTALITGDGNTNNGWRGLYGMTGGAYNYSGGYSAARFLNDGSTTMTTANNSVFIGANIKAGPTDAQTNQIGIGYGVLPNGSNTVTIGNSSITGNYFNGSFYLKGITSTDAPTFTSELGTTASGTNWSGTSLLTGYTHTTGSTVVLTGSAVLATNYYQVILTISGRTAGTVDLQIGGVTYSSLSVTQTLGPKSLNTTALTLTPTTDFDGTVSISYKYLVSQTQSIKSTYNSSSTLTNEFRSGNQSVYIGVGSGSRSFPTATNNTAIGFNSLASNTVGSNNSAFGLNTLISNTSGVLNSAYGSNSLTSNINGNSNSGFGYGSLNNNNSGNYNTAIGWSSLYSNTTANQNVGIGREALYSNLTGSNTIAIGYIAGKFIANGTTGATFVSNSVIIGDNTKVLADGQTNQVVIGSNTTGNGSNTVTIGNSSITDQYLTGVTHTNLSTAYVEKTTTYTATTLDYTINCTTGTFTLTLPTAIGNTGRIYIVKNSGAGTITMAGTSAQTFDAVTSPTIATGVAAQYQSTGANWIKIN